MDPVSSLPAAVALTGALLTAFILAKRFGEPPEPGRFASIDGLRGFLAFFVFLHHSCIWYFYLRSGKWALPPSNLYTHFGQSSVAVFFMITGFLFFSKLIDGRSKEIDWERLYISRFLRLVPLYLFVVAIMLVLVLIITQGILHEPIHRLIIGIVKWVGFAILGAPDINGVDLTWSIVAGVTWSLEYEWIFYFALPVLALAVGVKPPLAYIGLGVVSLTAVFNQPSIHHLPFLGGIIAAFLVRFDAVRRIASTSISSVIAISCLVITVAAFPSAYELVPLLLLTIFFILIACGNSLFGLLTNLASRTLGDFSYGIYLIHGIILFTTFNFVLGLPSSRHISASEHWIVVAVASPMLVVACFLTYRFIEYPSMQKTAALTLWLRSWMATRFNTAR